MKLLLFAAALSLTAEEKLTPIDRAQIALADAQIAKAESEYQTRLLQKQTLIAQICERVDAPLSACSIDLTSGAVTKRKIEPKVPEEKKK